MTVDLAHEGRTWGLIGYGNIGQEVAHQIGKDYVAERMRLNQFPEFVIRSTGLMHADAITPRSFKRLEDLPGLPDVTFIAIPGSDDGQDAYDYMSFLLAEGKMAVTAEKSALANYFEELKSESDDFKNLGINATVGGGTRLLDVAKHHCCDIGNVRQLHMVVNGTLTSLFSSYAPKHTGGMSLGQATQHAITLGYAEPGADNPFDVIRGEAEKDVTRKTAIFFNTVGFADEAGYLDWKQLEFDLTNKDIDRAIKEARVRRFIVSLFPESDKTSTSIEDDIIGGFNITHNGWRIVGGFRHLDSNPLFYDLGNLTGPGNGYVVGLGPDESDGVYSITGPGAGPKPTVNTMIDDYYTRLGNTSRP